MLGSYFQLLLLMTFFIAIGLAMTSDEFMHACCFCSASSGLVLDIFPRGAPRASFGEKVFVRFRGVLGEEAHIHGCWASGRGRPRQCLVLQHPQAALDELKPLLA